MERVTPLRAIRAKCLECAGGSRKKVRVCARGGREAVDSCPLHPYRMGRNPARKGIGAPLSSENARLLKKPTAQADSFDDKKPSPQGSTPEINLGHPPSKFGQVGPAAVPGQKRRKLIRAAEAFLREFENAEGRCRDGTTRAGDPPGGAEPPPAA